MEQKLRDLIKESMIEKNKIKTMAFKSILETAQKMAKEKREALTNSLIIQAGKKELKIQNEILEECIKANRIESANECRQKIAYCEAFLPKPMTSNEILICLKTNNVPKNMKDCMSFLKTNYNDILPSGKECSLICKTYISN